LFVDPLFVLSKTNCKLILTVIADRAARESLGMATGGWQRVRVSRDDLMRAASKALCSGRHGHHSLDCLLIACLFY